MPLLVPARPNLTPPDPPDPPGPSDPPAPSPPRIDERIAVTWFPPDGGEWPLTIPAGVIRAQATNALGAAVPIAITTDPNPRGGVDPRHTQELERYILLPVLVVADSHQALVERWREIGDAFTQTTELDAPGILRVGQPDGTIREIECRYFSGWEGVPEHGWDWDVAPALTLLAPRPWWRGPSVLAIERTFTDGGTSFFAPYPTLSTGQVLGESTIVNPGQVRAWPTWTITGPLSELIATNTGTGEEFTLNPDWDGGGDLGVGETVTISTDPVRVRGPAGEIWTGAISGTLWGLTRGANEVNFNASGADTGTTVRLEFRPLYQVA